MISKVKRMPLLTLKSGKKHPHFSGWTAFPPWFSEEVQNLPVIGFAWEAPAAQVKEQRPCIFSAREEGSELEAGMGGAGVAGADGTVPGAVAVVWSGGCFLGSPKFYQNTTACEPFTEGAGKS